MCGIIGIVGTQARAQARDDQFTLATEQLTHRGPDGHGIERGAWGQLGHRRLSIIDLSTDGRQPMRDTQTGVMIAYNGELYNYIELRSELKHLGHSFSTNSDTEVLLKAYLQWGEHCLTKLNAMFAFAILDPRTDTVLLARDRFGVKPLYYVNGPRFLAFASEPKALITLGVVNNDPDDQAVADFLVGGRYAGSNRSFLRDVTRLKAAHCISYCLHPATLRSWRYWDYPGRVNRRARTNGQTFEEFASLFDSAVQLRQRADVPVALSLSGGLDSTAILASMTASKSRAPLCFTSTFDVAGVDEADWATEAANSAGADLITCPVRSTDWLETLTQCTYHLDGPVANPSVIPVWHLMRQVSERGIKVLLEGQGADELLGGYVQYATAQLSDTATHPSEWHTLPHLLHSAHKLFGPKTLSYTFVKDNWPGIIRRYRDLTGQLSLLTPQVAEAGRDDIHFIRAPISDRQGADRRLWLDHSDVQLPRLLHYGDALSMAHGVETRMPFMDYRLVEWAFALDIDARLDPKASKWMIRRYLTLHNQKTIARRSDKKGYPTPYLRWFANMTSTNIQELLPPHAPVFQYVQRDAVLKAFTVRKATAQFGAGLLFRIVALQSWLQGRNRTRTDNLAIPTSGKV
jgi:asparagine synthase (glutamine-hydrolysing)